jgi:hypothetical protein
MKNQVCLVPAVLMIFLLCSVPAFALEGPLQMKNQFPIFLPINQPYLEQASTESSFSLSLSHSSVFVTEDSAHWTANLDLELTELNIRCRKDIPDLFEVGVDIPVLRATPDSWMARWSGITRPSAFRITGETRDRKMNFCTM